MKNLSEKFWLQLLEQNPIIGLFREHTDVIAHDKEFSCRCPFHSETACSCRIYPEIHAFYCPVCRTGGDTVTFVRITQRLSFEDAVEWLAHRANLTIPAENQEYTSQTRHLRQRCYDINRETANFYYRCLTSFSGRNGLQYLINRKLLPGTIRKYGLGFAPNDWHQLRDYLMERGYSEEELILANVCRKGEKGNVYDNFRNRVIFPIVGLDGHVIGFGGRVLDDSKPKYLNTSDTPVFDKGSNLFSLHLARNAVSSPIILAEGYMDVIAMNQAGFENVVATLGTAITPQQARLLRHHTSDAVIAYDSDAAGQNATLKALKHFREVGIKARILHMENAKDPDEFIKTFGASKFHTLIQEAGSAEQFQLDHCRNGLDLTTENGRTTMLRRSVQVLAEMTVKAEREIFISRIAHELEIRPEILKQQVENQVRKQTRISQKEMFHAIETDFYRQNANAPPKTGLSQSEKIILAYLMHRPEAYQKLSAALKPENFITEFHRKLYTLLCQVIPEYVQFQPSFLGSFLSCQEMCLMMDILYSFHDIPLSEDAAFQCIRNLQSAGNRTAASPNMTDDDLIQVFANKKKQTHIH